MTYRVIFDFGDIEVTVYHKAFELNNEKIIDGAIQQLIDRGFGLAPEESIKTIEACPEWEEK